MDPIASTAADFEVQEPGEQLTYQEVADRWGVSRSAVSRRHRGVSSTSADHYAEMQALSPPQELQLVQYIEEPNKHGLPPTNEMIHNFASEIAGRLLGPTWVSRFINQQGIHLIIRWSSGVDRVRFQADDMDNYELYFDLLHGKMVQYKVQRQNTYNMGEKGFMLGVLGRSHRVFSKATWVKGGALFQVYKTAAGSG
jgi:hypothetical protein